MAVKADTPKIGDLVEITWMDASFDLDDPTRLIKLRTVGWIVEKTTEFIMIASESSPDNPFKRSFTCIPTAIITKVRLLA